MLAGRPGRVSQLGLASCMTHRSSDARSANLATASSDRLLRAPRRRACPNRSSEGDLPLQTTLVGGQLRMPPSLYIAAA
jgi:hypothetical protein